MIDILAALEGTSPNKGSDKCELQRFIDSIPPGQPHREELVRLVETVHDPKAALKGDPETLAAKKMAVALSRMGFKTSSTPVLDHRNRNCRCFR